MNFRSRIELPFPGERDPRPTVRLPSAGVPRSVLLIGVGCLALATFLFLRGNDIGTDQLQGGTRRLPLSSPAPLQAPTLEAGNQFDGQSQMLARDGLPSPQPMPSGASVPMVIYRDRPTERASAAPVWARSTSDAVWSSPSVPQEPQPFDPASAATPSTGKAPAIAFDRGGATSWSTGSSIASRQPQGANDDPSVSRPRPAPDAASTIQAGTIIPAVLETPIDTGQSGMARAVISKAIRSYDGTRVLIPRGSKVVGSVDGSGGSQVLVKWTELTLPDGTSFVIDSPAASADGRTGIPGKTRNGGAGRVLGGLLQTALIVGSSLAIGGGGAIVMGLPSTIPGTMGGRPRSSRTTVEAGMQISIVTSKALDFSTAPQL